MYVLQKYILFIYFVLDHSEICRNYFVKKTGILYFHDI